MWGKKRKRFRNEFNKAENNQRKHFEKVKGFAYHTMRRVLKVLDRWTSL
jgi:23S rRNA maturation-related 3'-5' exoribonuclease YhaM